MKVERQREEEKEEEKRRRKEKKEKQKKQEEEQEKTKTYSNEIFRYFVKEEMSLNEELFKKHFNFQTPSDMLMYLYKTN